MQYSSTIEMAFLYRKKHLGGGITLDVGVYTLHFVQMIFQQEPKSIKATGIVNDDGVDVEVNAELTYPGNKTAKIRLSAINTFENAAIIQGTKGTLTVHNKRSHILNIPFLLYFAFIRYRISSFQTQSLDRMGKKLCFHHSQMVHSNIIMMLAVV